MSVKNNSEKYYTVDEIAELIKVHPKTLRRYIREGRLRATKVGKSWRVSGHDLSVFTEGSGRPASAPVSSEHPAGREEIKVSAVIDIPVTDTQESVRIATTLTAALNSKPSGYGSSSLRTQYLMPENVIRVMIWGSLEFTQIMFSYITELTEPAE
jgi:excisionase family DNA binding protein